VLTLYGMPLTVPLRGEISVNCLWQDTDLIGDEFNQRDRWPLGGAQCTARVAQVVLSAFAPRSLFDCARCGYRAVATETGWMECTGCGSAAVSERSECTAQGYRRFRCRACGKQFNERSAGSLNRTQYPSDVIALVVLWRLRYKLALRDLPEMFLIRGIVFSHEAVRDWETKLTPALAENLRRRRRGKVGRSWYVDETYIKVHGHWRYLYRAIDRSGALVDVMFSEHRDMAAAKAFFESAKMVTGVTPDRVTTDGHDSYPRAIRTVLGTRVRHRDSQYLNNRLEQDHRGVKGRYGPMRGFKCPRSAGDFCRAYDELRNFLRSRSRTNQQVSADYRRFHFLRRTATVLRVLQVA
jgi:putative transposase